MMIRPRKVSLAFYLLIALVGLYCLWIANTPLAILFGKVPDADWNLIARVGLKIELPVIVVGALCLIVAVRQFRLGAPIWVACCITLFAPFITGAALYFVMKYISP